MILGRRLAVVLPAYNAARTLRRTVEELPREYIDDIILVDDASKDQTGTVGRELGIEIFVHSENRGYGANQKTCYARALERGADIVVMVHPDYQYSPKLVPAMATMIASGHFDIVLGSRITGGALEGGMPLYKFVANRILTLVDNVVLGQHLSEYHSGFRAFSRKVLEFLPLGENSDGFLFDNEILVQAAYFGFRTGEVSCPARYFPEASSVGFFRGLQYGAGVLITAAKYLFARSGIRNISLFDRGGRRIFSCLSSEGGASDK